LTFLEHSGVIGLAGRALAELARDGAWTVKQLEARLVRWNTAIPDRYLRRTPVRVHPTAWTRRTVSTEIATPSARGAEAAAALGVPVQRIRSGELEHALGLAELRWRCGVSYDHYIAQDGIGRTHRQWLARGGTSIQLGPRLADGLYVVEGGVILCEYDHGRYTAPDIRQKIAAFSIQTYGGKHRVRGAIWGVPTADRSARLGELGVAHSVVMEPETWLI
jgi:hypothetical protein